jgi:hypothetical protein
MTLYPVTKCTPERAVDLVERFGRDRIMANSAGDWGKSNPMNMPDFIRALRTRGHDDATIRKLVYDNPLLFFSQAKRFNFWGAGQRDMPTSARPDMPRTAPTRALWET